MYLNIFPQYIVSNVDSVFHALFRAPLGVLPAISSAVRVLISRKYPPVASKCNLNCRMIKVYLTIFWLNSNLSLFLHLKTVHEYLQMVIKYYLFWDRYKKACNNDLFYKKKNGTKTFFIFNTHRTNTF